MKDCWAEKPADRPNFTALVQRLDHVIESNMAAMVSTKNDYIIVFLFLPHLAPTPSIAKMVLKRWLKLLNKMEGDSSLTEKLNFYFLTEALSYMQELLTCR